MSHNSAAQSAAAALESLNAGDSGVSAAHGHSPPIEVGVAMPFAKDRPHQRGSPSSTRAARTNPSQRGPSHSQEKRS